MKYVYEPVKLRAWLRDNRHHALPKRIENANEKYKSVIERLKEDFESIKSASKEEFFSWASKLNRRQKLLLPNLYKEDLDENVKKSMIQIMQQNAGTERRMFRVMVDVVYQTCNLDEMWNLLKYSYAAHKDRIEKRLTSEESKKWRNFLLSKDPVHHLAETAYYSEKGFLEELETFYLTENFPLYKYVIMDVFRFADEDFFIKEKDLYKKYFLQATNEEQQKMADGLIRNCRLNTVQDLGKLIYEKLKTYRRKPMLWKLVGEEEKQRFANWIMRLEIKDFFIGVNKDHERYQYWEKFVGKLEDVVVTDHKSTLIMYFPDVVVMEVLGKGAVYVYYTDEFEKHFQPKINQMLAEREKYANSWRQPREVKRSELMNKNLIVPGGRLIHIPPGRWQRRFDDWLSQTLGWEVRRDVLLKKEAERDEG